jgi:uncharacterized DUF497 family protein
MDELGIERLEIDPHIEDKLWFKHGVEWVEVEQALADDGVVVEEVGGGFYNAYGWTDGGRALLVVLVRKGSGLFKVVTARDRTRAELRRYPRE